MTSLINITDPNALYTELNNLNKKYIINNSILDEDDGLQLVELYKLNPKSELSSKILKTFFKNNIRVLLIYAPKEERTQQPHDHSIKTGKHRDENGRWLYGGIFSKKIKNRKTKPRKNRRKKTRKNKKRY
jgi:hypothetical protein